MIGGDRMETGGLNYRLNTGGSRHVRGLNYKLETEDGRLEALYGGLNVGGWGLENGSRGLENGGGGLENGGVRLGCSGNLYRLQFNRDGWAWRKM